MKKGRRPASSPDLAAAERALRERRPDLVLALLGKGRGGPRAEHLRGLAFLQLSKPREALTHLRRAAPKTGGSSAVWADLGQACWQCGRFADAAAALERAVRLAPERADLYQALGACHQQAGDVASAVAVFERALQHHPDAAALHFNLGAAFKRQHRLEDAALAYARAHALAPADVDTAGALGVTHIELGRFEAAVAPLEAATGLAPARADLLGFLGYALTKAGQGGRAVTACQAAYEASGRDPQALADLGSAQLAAGDPDGALASSERLLGVQPGARTALSNAVVALTELGRGAEARQLADLERFIVARPLPVPQGYPDIEAFNQALVEHVFSHPEIELDRASLSCHQGTTSGELLVEPLGPLALFAAGLEAAAADYVAALDPDDSHPFVRSRPPRWRLSAWATVLRDQGYQHAHIHALAWLSGVYYLSLPPGVGDGEAVTDGCIEFGRPPDYFVTRAVHPTRVLRPRVGQLLLFPSYYYHRTVPFSDPQARISIAFDFQALEDGP